MLPGNGDEMDLSADSLESEEDQISRMEQSAQYDNLSEVMKYILNWVSTNLVTKEDTAPIFSIFKQNKGLLKTPAIISTILLIVAILFLQIRSLGEAKIEELLETNGLDLVLNNYISNTQIINQLAILLTLSEDQLKEIYNTEVYDLTLQIRLTREGIDQAQEIRLADVDFIRASDESIVRNIRFNVWSMAGIDRPTSIEVSSVDLLRTLTDILAIYGEANQDGSASRLRFEFELNRRVFGSQDLSNYQVLSDQLTALGFQFGFFTSGNLNLITEYVPFNQDGILNRRYRVSYTENTSDVSYFYIEFNTNEDSGVVESFEITREVNGQALTYVLYNEPKNGDVWGNNVDLKVINDLLANLLNIETIPSETYG